jgi:hypothetical protein
MDNNESKITDQLRIMFVIHFLIDVSMALPLFIAPVWFLEALGWNFVDPYTTRLTAAALFGIGIESYFARNSTMKEFDGLLNLKVIWSLTAVIGIAWSLIEKAQGNPLFAYLVLILFGVFHVIWVYYKLQTRKNITH